jgi:hypothetical protein
MIDDGATNAAADVAGFFGQAEEGIGGEAQSRTKVEGDRMTQLLCRLVGPQRLAR